MAFTAQDLVIRWPRVKWFVLYGVACIIIGGVVAAVATPTNFGHGPWLAAFAVLVGGMAQIALGGGQAWLAAKVPPRRLVRGELAAWNLGNVGVVVGTLVALPALTTLGGLAEVAALVLFLVGVRRIGEVPAWARHTFRVVLVILVVSIPTGLVLAWVHPSG